VMLKPSQQKLSVLVVNGDIRKTLYFPHISVR